MISQADFARVSDRLLFMKGAERKLIDEFLLRSHKTRLSAGRDVFVEGDRVEAIALVDDCITPLITSHLRSIRLT